MAIWKALPRVAKITDIWANGADSQTQCVGDVAFGYPFPPKMREQSVPLGFGRWMILRAVFGSRERADVP
ncbi:MAG: hypothetical protein ACRDNW_27625, partial [Trebonia sp.]